MKQPAQAPLARSEDSYSSISVLPRWGSLLLCSPYFSSVDSSSLNIGYNHVSGKTTCLRRGIIGHRRDAKCAKDGMKLR